MSYPDPVYLGATGERNAVHVPRDREPDVVFEAGTCTYLSTGASTGGLFGLYRWDMSGPPTGPGPHFHRTIAESFFILEGTVRIYDGDRWIETTSGDYVHVPAGGIHGFRNESGEPASMLLHFAPGAPREGYFEGLLRVGDLTDEERDAFFAEHDNVWL